MPVEKVNPRKLTYKTLIDVRKYQTDLDKLMLLIEFKEVFTKDELVEILDIYANLLTLKKYVNN